MAFEYDTGFPVADPHCPTTFERSFEHADWVDGEDVVQAGTEKGFNARFHEIERDLDTLGGVCMSIADIRRSLRNLLDEIRDEINRPGEEAYRELSARRHNLVTEASAAVLGRFQGEITRIYALQGIPEDQAIPVFMGEFNDLLSRLFIHVEEACRTGDPMLRELPEIASRIRVRWLSFAFHWLRVSHSLRGEAAVVANSYIDHVLSLFALEELAQRE